MDVDSDLLVALAHGPLGERPLVHRGDRSWTGAEIAEATDEVAARLRRAGVAPGTAVGVVVPATPTGVVMLLAVWRAGAVCAPVDADRSGPDLERVLADVRPAVVVQPSNDAGSLVPVVAARTGEPRAFSTDVALVLTSPDASGPAAPVRIDHSDLLAAVAAACDRIPGRHADDHRVPAPDLVPLPLASWDGVLGILTAVRTGAAVILLDPESPEGVVGAVRSSGLTTAVLAAPTVARLLDDPGIGSLAPLRTVRVCPGRVSPGDARRFRDRFGVTLHNAYGRPELGGEVIGWSAADLRDFADAKLGSVGRPHAGIEVRIVDPAGTDVPADVPGEIRVRTPRSARSGDVGALGPGFRDGWGFWRTGEHGHVDPDGFVWIDGPATGAGGLA